MSSAELHSEFLPARGSNFCSKVTPKRPSRSNTLFPHQPRSVRLQAAFRSQPIQKKMLFANHPHAPCIVLSDQFQHLLKAMLLKTTRNCSDLLLQLLHKGGSTPPWSQSELLLLGGVDPPQACDLLLLGGVYPPRPVGPVAAAFWGGDPYEEVL